MFHHPRVLSSISNKILPGTTGSEQIDSLLRHYTKHTGFVGFLFAPISLQNQQEIVLRDI